MKKVLVVMSDTFGVWFVVEDKCDEAKVNFLKEIHGSSINYAQQTPEKSFNYFFRLDGFPKYYAVESYIEDKPDLVISIHINR